MRFKILTLVATGCIQNARVLDANTVLQKAIKKVSVFSTPPFKLIKHYLLMKLRTEIVTGGNA